MNRRLLDVPVCDFDKLDYETWFIIVESLWSCNEHTAGVNLYKKDPQNIGFAKFRTRSGILEHSRFGPTTLVVPIGTVKKFQHSFQKKLVSVRDFKQIEHFHFCIPVSTLQTEGFVVQKTYIDSTWRARRCLGTHSRELVPVNESDHVISVTGILPEWQ